MSSFPSLNENWPSFFRSHQKALLSHGVSASVRGTWEERFQRQAAWTEWEELLKQPPESGVEESVLLKRLEERLKEVERTQPNFLHRTAVMGQGEMSECDWLHPIAWAFTLLHEGTRVDEAWARPLFALACRQDVNQPAALVRNAQGESPISLHTWVIQGLLKSMAFEKGAGGWTVVKGTPVAQVRRKILEKNPWFTEPVRFWEPSASLNQALDGLLTQFLEISEGDLPQLNALVMLPHLFDSKACPSEGVLERFQEGLRQKGGRKAEALGWAEPFQARIEQVRMEERWNQAPVTGRSTPRL